MLSFAEGFYQLVARKFCLFAQSGVIVNCHLDIFNTERLFDLSLQCYCFLVFVAHVFQDSIAKVLLVSGYVSR